MGNLLRALEAYTGPAPVEGLRTPLDHRATGTKEVWLTDLPHVLTFQLQRVRYSQTVCRVRWGRHGCALCVCDAQRCEDVRVYVWGIGPIQTGQGEKIHDRFTFPPQLFMDRYLYANREQTRQLRSKEQMLQAEIAAQRHALEQYTRFNVRTRAAPCVGPPMVLIHTGRDHRMGRHHWT
jgi:hypothetical protein